MGNGIFVNWKFTKVYLVEGSRNENGETKQSIIKTYGNLEESQKRSKHIRKIKR